IISVPWQTADGTYSATILVSESGGTAIPLTLTVQLNRNIIVNSGFEKGLGGWWSPAGVAVLDETVKHSGMYSMRMVLPSNGNTYSRTDQKLYLVPGKKYVLKAWLKGEKAGKVTVEFRSLN